MASHDLPSINPLAAAQLILDLRPGAIVAFVGRGETLRAAFDLIDAPAHGPRALFAQFARASSPETLIEETLNLFAETLLSLWPTWFEEERFSACRDDALGREAVKILAEAAARGVEGLSPAFAGTAARLALAGRLPRDTRLAPALELAQLARAINPLGLSLIADLREADDKARPVILHALEWVARQLNGGVAVLFAQAPPDAPPYDRFSYGARRLADDTPIEEPDQKPNTACVSAGWLAPWRGAPHPLSETEKRIAAAIAGDIELAPLFSFNQTVQTVRGGSPRVDLLWAAGKLVVELDGFADHGQFHAFAADRHRDYELMLSGYAVLRLTNEEIALDLAKAIEKIRDVTRVRRAGPV
jgi:very-short-patch-repair endonuclease